MVEKLIQYGLSAAIAAFVAIITLFIKRKWEKEDKESKADKEILDRLDALSKKLEEHILSDKQDKIEEKRLKIIEFSDDLTHSVQTGVRYSKERFDRILELIDEYEAYCKENDKYPNSKADMAIKNVKKVYQTCTATNGFLS